MKDKLFNKLCTLTKDNLKKYLVKKLNMQSGDGYCFRQGTFPVLLTAHMDTVHKKQANNVIYTTRKDGNVIATSPDGIGGDDRCGVYMILKILEKVDCSVLFCEDEEVGSVGAKKFITTDLCKQLKDEKKFKYIIELDRANANDAVFYEDDNDEFHNFVTKEFYKKRWGTWSDICTLSPALEISSVNLSCGYYLPHTTNEYVIMQEMYKSIKETIKLLNRTDVTKEPFKFIRAYSYYSSMYNYYGDYYDDYDFERHGVYNGKYKTAKLKNMEEKNDKKPNKKCCLSVKLWGVLGEKTIITWGDSEADVWYKFFINNSSICYDDIIDYRLY